MAGFTCTSSTSSTRRATGPVRSPRGTAVGEEEGVLGLEMTRLASPESWLESSTEPRRRATLSAGTTNMTSPWNLIASPCGYARTGPEPQVVGVSATGDAVYLQPQRQLLAPGLEDKGRTHQLQGGGRDSYHLVHTETLPWPDARRAECTC